MKNLTYIFVVLLCFSTFSLDAQKRSARDHPITQTNDGDITNSCINIIGGQPYDYTNSLGVKHEFDGTNCSNVFNKLYIVAFDAPSYQANILGYTSLANGTSDPDGSECSYPDDVLLNLQTVSLTLEDLSLPCSFIPGGELVYDYHLAIMLFEYDIFVPLFLASNADYPCLEAIFPGTCFNAPANIGFKSFDFCYSCIASGNRVSPPNDDLGLLQKAQVNNQQSFSLATSPNPFSDQINVRIQSSSASNGVVELFDVQGKAILRQSVELSKGVNDLSLSGAELPKGLYFLQLKSDESIQTLKIIKGNH